MKIDNILQYIEDNRISIQYSESNREWVAEKTFLDCTLVVRYGRTIKEAIQKIEDYRSSHVLSKTLKKTKIGNYYWVKPINDKWRPMVRTVTDDPNICFICLYSYFTLDKIEQIGEEIKNPYEN